MVQGNRSLKQSNIVWLFPSTIIGYSRLGLLVAAIIVHLFFVNGENLWPRLSFVCLVGLSRLLDLLDGYLARRFSQTSYFGTLFDLLLDLVTHTVVWSVSGFFLATPLIILEWATGLYIAAFARQPSGHWKTVLIDRGPRLIKYYFSNNQRNVLSTYGNLAHFIFPMAIYMLLSTSLIYYLTIPGLILYEVVTIYMLFMLMRISARNGSHDESTC